MECDVQASFPYLRGLTGNRMLSSCDRIDAKASISRTRDLLPSWRWLITLCVATMLSSEAPSVASQAVDQGSALKSLARDWNAQDLLADWERNPLPDPCLGAWTGVFCDNATNTNVVILNFTAKGLKGPMPSLISQLVHLEELTLDDNRIEDPIPSEIGRLIHLRRLSLNNNSLTSLPPEELLMCNLTYLSLL